MRNNLEFVKPTLLSETRRVCSCKFSSENKLDIKEYDNADLQPRIGLTKCGQIYEHSLKYLTIDYSQYECSDEVQCYCDEEVLYIGRFITRWGHCITSNLMNLWVFLDPDKYNSVVKKTLVYVQDIPNLQLPSHFLEMLKLLGIDTSRLRHITENTRFRKVIVPDPCYYYDENENGQQRYTPEYFSLINNITKHICADESFPKVYFTRTKFRLNHRDYGESQIEKVFRKLGYTIISPEKLSFKEQVSILKGCKCFAATDGSVGHNSVFLKEGTECVFIRKVDWVNPYQALINHVKQLNVTTIDANWSFLLYNNNEPWEGPFFVYNNKRLREWSGVWTFFPVLSLFRYIMHYTPKWIRAKYHNMMDSKCN